MTRQEHRAALKDRTQRPVDTLYAGVTDRIIAELEAGRIPWVQPWDSAVSIAGLPRNAGSGRAYSGINILILWQALFAHGFEVQRWLTFRQAQALGGVVRKGERGTMVCYADSFTPKDRDGELQGDQFQDGQERRQVAFLKRFTVFNVAQCEGLPQDLYTQSDVALGEREAIPHAEDLIAATWADIRVGSPHACYVPSQDRIEVPAQQAFPHQINYYRTVLHELGHWTGHGTRLARDQTCSFGSPGYAREELVAELCSAFVCAALGIVPTVRHCDYIGAWLDVLRTDNRAIFRAASQASKAADYLLACHARVSGEGGL
jgi:antirestriction protein ArdC